MNTAAASQHVVGVERVGERLGALRLCESEALSTMQASLVRDGQLQAFVVFTSEAGLEVVDGFKRLRAARALGWRELRAHTLVVDDVAAKVAILALHDRRGRTELEEGWLVRGARALPRRPPRPAASAARRASPWPISKVSEASSPPNRPAVNDDGLPVAPMTWAERPRRVFHRSLRDRHRPSPPAPTAVADCDGSPMSLNPR